MCIAMAYHNVKVAKIILIKIAKRNYRALKIINKVSEKLTVPMSAPRLQKAT